MTKEIKICLIGAIISGIAAGLLLFLDAPQVLTIIAKIFYALCTIGLLYAVVRLLTNAEVVNKGS